MLSERTAAVPDYIPCFISLSQKVDQADYHEAEQAQARRLQVKGMEKKNPTANTDYCFLNYIQKDKQDIQEKGEPLF